MNQEFDFWNSHWEGLTHNLFECTELDGFGTRFCRVVNKWLGETDEKILETGCGTGRFCIKFAKELQDSIIVGLDASLISVELARQASAIRDLENTRFVRGDIFRIPFPDNSFDIVYSEGVIEHFRNFKAGLREKIRVTKPKGKIITAVPNKFNFPHTIYKIIMNENYEYGYEKSFTRGELKTLYEDLGLEKIEVEGFHPVHGITRLNKYSNLFGIFGKGLDKAVVKPLDRVTNNKISHWFGFEIVAKGIKEEK